MMSSKYYYNIGHRVSLLSSLLSSRRLITGVIVSFSPNKYKIVLDDIQVLANAGEPGWLPCDAAYLSVGPMLTTEEMLTHPNKLVQELPGIVAMIKDA